MTDRLVNGKLGSDYVLRASLPGYDVLTEALGSANISFDTRLTDIGTVVAGGLIQCGGSAISFPTMGYVPVVAIAKWDGSDLSSDYFFYAPSPNLHWWIPSIAIVTTNSIQVVPFTSPFVHPSTTNYYDPTGTYYLYAVFASG